MYLLGARGLARENYIHVLLKAEEIFKCVLDLREIFLFDLAVFEFRIRGENYYVVFIRMDREGIEPEIHHRWGIFL